jgi:chromosome segregation ATPase
MNIKQIEAIERDWKSVFDNASDGFRVICADYRTIKKTCEELEKQIKKAKDETAARAITEKAEYLEKEIKYKEDQIIKYDGKIKELQEKLEELEDDNFELKSRLELKGDEKLSNAIAILEKLVEKRYKEAMELRTQDQITETAMTNFTLGYQLIYLARIAYEMIIKENKQLDS